jgi:hypothetical protein
MAAALAARSARLSLAGLAVLVVVLVHVVAAVARLFRVRLAAGFHLLFDAVVRETALQRVEAAPVGRAAVAVAVEDLLQPRHVSALRLYSNWMFDTITGPRNASTGPIFMPSNEKPSAFVARTAAHASTALRLDSVKTLGRLTATFTMLARRSSSTSTFWARLRPPQPSRSSLGSALNSVATPSG